MADDATSLTFGLGYEPEDEGCMDDYQRCHGGERQGRRLRAGRPSGTFSRTAPAAWLTLDATGGLSGERQPHSVGVLSRRSLLPARRSRPAGDRGKKEPVEVPVTALRGRRQTGGRCWTLRGRKRHLP